MHVTKHILPVTTNATGDATAYTPPLTGLINRIEYRKTDYADGVDFAITVDGGVEIWTQADVDASATRYPLVDGNDTDGTAQTGAFAAIAVADDRVKIVVDDGGNAKTGTFVIYILGN